MRFWGVWPPSKFYEASKEDIAFAIAAYEEEMRVEAWNSKLSEKKNKESVENLSLDD